MVLWCTMFHQVDRIACELVFLFCRYHSSYATPGIFHIPLSSWYQMNVAVKNCLASSFPSVYTYIEGNDTGVTFHQCLFL